MALTEHAQRLVEDAKERQDWVKFHNSPHSLQSFHVGPTIVLQMRDKFREAGIQAMAGTEHVHVKHEVDRASIISNLRDKHGTTFGIK